MRKIHFLLCLSLPLFSFAQSTPATGEPVYVHYEEIQGDRNFGDTITFDGLTSGTVVTSQYASSNGAIFSGWPQPNFCDTYDYAGNYGSVLKSSSWYDGIRIDFVNPSDTSQSVSICSFGFENPIDTEVDYIVVKFYDASNNLLHTHMSTSPEIVTIDLGVNGATYVTMDDDQSTAYVVDNIWFAASCISQIEENSTSQLLVFPNPTKGILTLDPHNEWIGLLEVLDISGRLVKQLTVNTTTTFQIDISELPDGIYLIRDCKKSFPVAVKKF